MLYTSPLILGLAALVAGQQSEIDFAGDVPQQCQNYQPCEAAIYPAAQCGRNLNGPWSQDYDYLNCVFSAPNFCGNLQQCYQCVGTYKREGDIKKLWEYCNTPGYGQPGYGPGGNGGYWRA